MTPQEKMQQLAKQDVDDTSKPKPVDPPITIAKCKVHLLNLEKEAMTRVGEKGFNPFIWIKDCARPLERRLVNEPSESVIAEILSLKVPAKNDVEIKDVDMPKIDPQKVYDNQR